MLLGIACGVVVNSNPKYSISEMCSAEFQPANKTCKVEVTNFPPYVYPSYLKYYFQEIIVPELLGRKISKNDISVSSDMQKQFDKEPIISLNFTGEREALKFMSGLRKQREFRNCKVSIEEKGSFKRTNKKKKDLRVPTSVLISNLPPNTTSKDLFYFFYGQVVGLSRVDDPEVYQHNGKVYGRLILNSLEMAESCINKLNGKLFDDRKMWKMQITMEEQSSVFVDMLCKSVTLTRVMDAFSPARRVLSFKVFMNESGKATDVAKVTFINQSSARKCIKLFNGAVCSIGKQNRAITVCEYEVFQRECVVCYNFFDECDLLYCERQQAKSEIHSICHDCVRQHARSLITDGHVGQGGAGLPCSTEGCDQVILWAKVKRLADENTVQLLEKRLTNVALLNVKGMEYCKSCDYAEIIDDSNVCRQMFFYCRNKLCLKSFCRECKIDRSLHNGYTCSKMNPKSIKNRAEQRKFEESLSAVTVRICPQCKTQFQKIDGCNKVICPTCRLSMCYLCRETNVTYYHFSVKCGLSTSADTADAARIAAIHTQAKANRNTEGCQIS